MGEVFKPYDTTDIENFVEKGKQLSVSESSLSFKAIIGDTATKYHNIISKYYKSLKPYIISMTLSDDELYRYQYQPNLLSYELYDTPELGYSLLYINNMVSVTQFNKSTINVFTTNFLDILEELITLTKEDIEKNRADLELEY